MENIIILQKLYSLKNELTNLEDISIIDNIILKYNSDVKVDFEYTDKEIYYSKNVFKRILKSMHTEPEYRTFNKEKTKVISIDGNMLDRIELFDEERDIIIHKYSLLRIKNNKHSNVITRQNAILIQNLFRNEMSELITKIYKL